MINSNYSNPIKEDYSNLKTFVINLDDYKENYIKQLPYLESIGLKVERFNGINALKDEHLKPEYKQYISNFAFNFTPKSIIGGSVSHILCSKYIYNNILDKFDYFLIMEDDAFPIYNKKKFNEELNKTVNEITIFDKNWDIIHLHNDGPFPNYETYNCHFFCGSVAAYLISKKGLNKIIKKKVYYHIDFVTFNPINFNKYKSRKNLFYTNEKESLNRNINNTKNLKYYSLYLKSYALELFNNYTNLLTLRGEKNYENFLEFKILKMPYFKKEYTANEFIDYLLGLILTRKIINYIK